MFRSHPGLRVSVCWALALLVPVVGPLLCACSEDSGSVMPVEASHADLVFLNGEVFTAVAGADRDQAIAVRGNTIVAVGSDEAVSELIAPSTVVTDLDGRSVIPGFHDAHIHFYYGTLASLGLDLMLAPALPLTLRKVADYARSHPDLEWIIGRGWAFDTFPGGRLPSKEDLDTVLRDRPAVLVHVSGHYAWVNSEALDRAGIDSSTPDPPRGSIGRDPVTGEPDGILYEAAQGLVYGQALAGIDPDTKTRLLLENVRLLNSLGITSVDEVFLTLGASDVDLDSYLTLEEQGFLSLRVNLFLSGDLGESEIRGWQSSLAGHGIRLAGLKVFVDGNFQGRTAWLKTPYADRPESLGMPIYTQEELDAIARKGQCLGLPVKFHAIGDQAVQSALDAIEAAQSCSPMNGSKHSLEHIELLDPDDLPRFSALDAVASVQPVAAFFNTTLLRDSMLSAVGPERIGRIFPNRSLKEAGTEVLFGTDWPAVPFMEPLLTILASLVRGGETDPCFDSVPVPQAYTLEEALSAYTLLPAKAIGQDRVLGTLEKGKLADFVVLSGSLFTPGGVRSLLNVKVDLTVMDGRVVYDRHTGSGQ